MNKIKNIIISIFLLSFLIKSYAGNLTGSELNAFMAVIDDFSSEKLYKDSSTLNKYNITIKDFDLKIQEDLNFYLIRFVLKRKNMKGGGALYKVDSKTFKVINKIYYK